MNSALAKIAWVALDPRCTDNANEFMSDSTKKPKLEEETIALNLGAFAPGHTAKPPSEEEGMTMIVERAAAEVSKKAAPTGATPSKELLGAVAYSYAKG